MYYKKCRILNDLAGYEKWNVDHIIPKSKGGLHHEDNLGVMLKEHNMIKGDYYIEEDK